MGEEQAISLSGWPDSFVNLEKKNNVEMSMHWTESRSEGAPDGIERREEEEVKEGAGRQKIREKGLRVRPVEFEG